MRAVIRRYDSGVGSRGRLPGHGRRAVRRRPAQRGRPLHRQQGPHVGRRERPRQPDGRRRHPLRQPRRGSEPVRHQPPRAQLRLSVLLERGDLDGHGDGQGPGTQHLDPDQPGAFTEAKCQDANVVVPPAFALGAHLAPLDIVEYTGKGYPAAMVGGLFVTSHGSWNRESGQVGRMIVRLEMGANGPTAAENFLGESDGAGGLRQGDLGHPPGVDPRRQRRPADVRRRRGRRRQQDRLARCSAPSRAPRDYRRAPTVISVATAPLPPLAARASSRT